MISEIGRFLVDFETREIWSTMDIMCKIIPLLRGIIGETVVEMDL